mgnify:CR=1 FL=1
MPNQRTRIQMFLAGCMFLLAIEIVAVVAYAAAQGWSLADLPFILLSIGRIVG